MADTRDLRHILNKRHHRHHQRSSTTVFQDTDLRKQSSTTSQMLHESKKRRRCRRRRRRNKDQRTESNGMMDIDEMVVLDEVSGDDVDVDDDNNNNDSLSASSSSSLSSSLSSSRTKRPRRGRQSRRDDPTNERQSSRDSSSLSLSPEPEQRPIEKVPLQIRSMNKTCSTTTTTTNRRIYIDRKSRRHRHSSSYSRKKSSNQDYSSWEDRVQQFVKSLNVRVENRNDDDDDDDDNERENRDGIDKDEDGDEETNSSSNIKDIKSTPLIRFIGKRLKDNIDLKFEGVFQYNLLSLLSRSEWIAGKTMQLFENAGYKESDLYNLATSKGSGVLESELKTAIFTERVKLGSGNPQIVQQVLRVVEYIVKYFTSKGEDDDNDNDDNDDDNDDNDDDNDGKGNKKPGVEKNSANGKPIRVGLADFLKQLSREENERERKDEKTPIIPPNETPNPWSRMWDDIQASNLQSFQDLKRFLAKDLLRLYGRNQSDVFETAQEMVSCWVVAGFSLSSIRHFVIQTPTEMILPPPTPTLTPFRHVGVRSSPHDRKYLYDELLNRLKRHRAEFPSFITEEKLCYLVRKSLIYVMRGCDKIPNHSNQSNEQGMNIVFNYLPPGLREAEQRAKKNKEPYVNEEEEEEEGGGSTTTTTTTTFPISEEDKLSTDPLNAILNPKQVETSSKPNVLPNRKYRFVTLHLEWVVLKGKPQLYEISAYIANDMKVLNLYIVTPTLETSSDTMENLGFVVNPDRHEFYYVQVGIGCVKALPLHRAMEKCVSFLEDARNSVHSESKNNGLVVVTHSNQELGLFLQILEETGHQNILLDVVKGFGTLETFMERNKSKKFSYGGPKLTLLSQSGGSGGSGEEVFYHTELKRGICCVSNVVSKSKSEALYQSLEFMLDQNPPNYVNFTSSYCFPSFSPACEEIKQHLIKVKELYTLEVFIAAQLKAQRTILFLDGVFTPNLIKDLRDKASVVANRIVHLLVTAGYDKASLIECFKRNKEFMINSNVILDKMNMAQRLKVMDQTMRCIHIIKNYFTQKAD